MADQDGTARFTRDELVTVAMALEEFREEYGPGERELAARVNEVLRTAGVDEFVLAGADSQEENG